VVSERIGLADVGFFVQTYAHVVRSDDRDAAQEAAGFLICDGWDPRTSARLPDYTHSCSLTSSEATHRSVSCAIRRYDGPSIRVVSVSYSALFGDIRTSPH
jgi:hypothetical protein